MMENGLDGGDVLHPVPSDVEAGIKLAKKMASRKRESKAPTTTTHSSSSGSVGGGSSGGRFRGRSRGKGDDATSRTAILAKKKLDEEDDKSDGLASDAVGPPSGFDDRTSRFSVRVCDGPVWALRCSGKGLVATGGADGTLCVRHVKSLARRLDAEVGNSFVVNENAESISLMGHLGPIFDVSWAEEDDASSSCLLVSASADATARVWRVSFEPGPPPLPPREGQSSFLGSGTLSAQLDMSVSHGGAAFAACFVTKNTFATGGMDRMIRLWHVPTRQATSWAHCNDAITAIAASKLTRDNKGVLKKRVAVGLRGGQIFGYSMRTQDKLDFDDMYLSTVRAGAFLEAEKVGTAGAHDHPADEAARNNGGSSSPPNNNKSLETKSSGVSSRSGKRRSFFFGSRKSDGADSTSSSPSSSQIDDSAPPGDLSDDDGVSRTEHVATPDFVRRRVTTLAWSPSFEETLEDGSPALNLIGSANSSGPIKIFSASHPNRPPRKNLAGGVRISLGCGAEASESGRLAVGASEDGAVLVWRLDQNNSGFDVQPARIDVGVSPNAKIEAITRACFVPATPALEALGGRNDDNALGGDDSDPSEAFVLATDYSGRLVLFKRGGVGNAKKPSSPTVSRQMSPGQVISAPQAHPNPETTPPMTAKNPLVDQIARLEVRHQDDLDLPTATTTNEEPRNNRTRV